MYTLAICTTIIVIVCDLYHFISYSDKLGLFCDMLWRISSDLIYRKMISLECGLHSHDFSAKLMKTATWRWTAACRQGLRLPCVADWTIASWDDNISPTSVTGAAGVMLLTIGFIYTFCTSSLLNILLSSSAGVTHYCLVKLVQSFFSEFYLVCVFSVFNLYSVLYFPPWTNINGTVVYSLIRLVTILENLASSGNLLR